jgi:hypothetical protein
MRSDLATATANQRILRSDLSVANQALEDSNLIVAEKDLKYNERSAEVQKFKAILKTEKQERLEEAQSLQVYKQDKVSSSAILMLLLNSACALMYACMFVYVYFAVSTHVSYDACVVLK